MRWTGGLVVVAVLVAALAGCGGSGSKQTTTTTALRVYFLLNGKVQGVRRNVPETTKMAEAAFAALVNGRSKSESEFGLSTALPSITMTFTRSSPDYFSVAAGALPNAGIAQIVYTLTQFRTSRTVYVNDKPYTRADFEDLTPAILVESPLPFQKVASPLRATGTANTFEATFQYDLVDSDGKVVKTHFVTATSGTGTRGTFDFTVPFSLDRGGRGKLVVYELSAKDGSRIHAVAIPITLTP